MPGFKDAPIPANGPSLDDIENFGLTPLSDKEFKSLRDLIYQRLGINLTQQKRALLAGRLRKILHNRGFNTYAEYYDFLVAQKDMDALSELANSISTNHTFFYREKEHFDYFIKTILPEIISRHRQRNDYDLGIWCAACSSGEEAYMLAMLMAEHFSRELVGWNAGLLATDISARVLEEAKKGIYPMEKLSVLPRLYRDKYMQPQPAGGWQVVASIKNQVTFRRLNLITPGFPFHKPFDIIFCRNVMIYFDEPTRQTLIKKFHDWLVPGGYLFIGHSETIRNSAQLGFRYLMPSAYQREA
jgi:chemotaxis protein methyltransferase CheR